MEDLFKGEIYLIRNKVNDKCYIGQTKKYVGSNNSKWGTEARWKSHVREALKYGKDHCAILNNAIRKYGSQNFEVEKLCDCDLTDIDEIEQRYIAEKNTLHPNGYNMRSGGKSPKDSELTRANKAQANIKPNGHDEKTKESISKGQLGNRRGAKPRKYPEDSQLPKYICAIRFSPAGNIYGYSVNSFPIGTDTKKYISKSFYDFNNPDLALQKANEFLKELEDKYAHVPETIKQQRIAEEPQIIADNKTESFKKHDNILPIVVQSKITGFKVIGIKDYEGFDIPERTFDKNTNRWNYDNALKFIEMIERYNQENKKCNDWINVDVEKRMNTLDELLPAYVMIMFHNGEKIGYKISGFPKKNEDGTITKVNKQFSSSKLTLEEKKNLIKEYLVDLYKHNKEINKKLSETTS